MKFYHNVLTEELFDEIYKDLATSVKEQQWASNIFAWNPELRKGILGNVIMSDIRDDLKEKIINQIKDHLPEYKQIECQYYIWNALSGIGIHNDAHMLFGGTIYLNKYWHFEDGGIFLYKKKNSDDEFIDEWTAVKPNNNTMILNDEQEPHMVTPVSPYAHDLRLTIQIWAK